MLERQLIQVAGVKDREEAEMLAECGVRYLGFPLRLDVNEEDLSEDEAARIVGRLKASCHAVLITYLNRCRDILDLCTALGVRTVQIHGDADVAELAQIKQRDPGLTVVKSLVVGLYGNRELQALLESCTPHVDGFITDTFDPTTGAAGATGKTHDWSVSRMLVECSRRPVILAGGLTPDNVKDAIEQVGPAGVDVHTGVENESGRKDRRKVESFVREAVAGFQRLGAEAVGKPARSP